MDHILNHFFKNLMENKNIDDRPLEAKLNHNLKEIKLQ